MATESVEYLEPEIGKSLCRVRRQNGNLGGYRTDLLVENISKTDMAALVCKRCQGILRKAYFSATSGEHFCKCCKNLLEPAEPNEQVRKIVHSLKSSCPLYDRGCEGIGKLGKCAKHLTICEFVYEQCELGCEIVLPRHELKIHMREHCAQREITCEYCDQYFKVCDMGYHMNQCDKMQLTSELGCDTAMCREDMAQHLEKYCRRVIEHCKLGCGIELPRDELEMHMNNECVQHMIPCKHCKRDFKVCDMRNHLEECPKMLLNCELKCGTVMCREDMPHHLEKDCGRVIEHCKLYCGIVLPREELKIHMKEKCEYRKVACEDCKKDFEFCDMLIHQPKCPKVRLKCKEGCGTTVDREDMAQHLEKDCGRVVRRCKLRYGKIVPRDELNIHMKEKCVQRMIPCEHCNIDFKACNMSNHNKKCKKMPLSCELGCGTTVSREKMAKHIGEECVEKKVECPFIKYKCEVGLIKRKKLNQHLEEKRTEHTELKLSAMEEIVMQQSEMIRKFSNRFTALCSITKTTKLKWKIGNIRNNLSSNLSLTSPLYEVAGFKFNFNLSSYASINIHFPNQETSKFASGKLNWPFKAKFLFRLICHNDPNGTLEYRSRIEIKQKDCNKSGYISDPVAQINAEHATNMYYMIDGGIDLEIFVILQ
ncbi:hypothetical protein LOD99_9210 [Oopsacas minuta]|uniref:TRAF-type domain-containing protein n=1 Tax=Oopsacas minuta TaxID=111878 RepID=A0AAV7JE32_9METZ|nr:hypothetical protein LOD99_9210 [Oopsacas minuta]